MPFPTGDAVFLLLGFGSIAASLQKSKSTTLISTCVAGSVTLFALRAAWNTFAWLRKDAHSNATLVTNTQVKHIRVTGNRLPSPYPNAWYVVAVSKELKPGAVTSVTICGKNLVVFRPLKEPVAVLDAYCTHLGSHLGLGSQIGSVTTDCLKCPFHGWCFDRNGELRSAPTADAPIGNQKAAIKSYNCLEKNGVILVWIDSTFFKSDTISEIPYSIPSISQVEGSSATYIYKGFVENITDCHINDIAENGADVSHLQTVHYPFVFPSMTPILSHTWKATWNAGEGERVHIADMTVDQNMCFLGLSLPGGVHVEIQQVGLSLVLLDMKTPLGRLFVIESVTPISPLKQRVLHTVYADPAVPSFLVQLVMNAHIIHHEKDVPIWANKKYLGSGEALLIKSDSNISLYRRWAKQFINDKSLTFEEAMRTDLKVFNNLEW